MLFTQKIGPSTLAIDAPEDPISVAKALRALIRLEPDDGFGVPRRRITVMPTQEIIIWTPGSMVAGLMRACRLWRPPTGTRMSRRA